MWLFIIFFVVLPVVSAIAFFASLFYNIMSGIYNSIQAVPPTPDVDAIVRGHDKPALLKYLPELDGKIAWLPLGTFPTPIHHATVMVDGKPMEIVLKREDLSDDKYGGNKVRTLQFQLGCAKSMLERERVWRNDGKEGSVVAIGAAGSNQCVAAAVHGSRFGLNVEAFWIAPEATDEEDNAFNILSVLSLVSLAMPLWTQKMFMLRHLATLLNQKRHKFMNGGGANVTGTLGHVGAVMELAEQIDAGEMERPRRLYLAAGSFCTTSGLLVGLSLARLLGKGGFGELAFPRGGEASPPGGVGFQLHPITIHHRAAMVPPLLRWWVRKLVRDTCATIRELGGPDLLPGAMDFYRHCLRLRCSFAGTYGSHTPKSKEAKALFGETISFRRDEGELPWLCGTFSGKSASAIIEDFRQDGCGDPSEGPVLLWSTKSMVQPVGSRDSFEHMDLVAENFPAFKAWVAHKETILQVRQPLEHTFSSVRFSRIPVDHK